MTLAEKFVCLDESCFSRDPFLTRPMPIERLRWHFSIGTGLVTNDLNRKSYGWTHQSRCIFGWNISDKFFKQIQNFQTESYRPFHCIMEHGQLKSSMDRRLIPYGQVRQSRENRCSLVTLGIDSACDRYDMMPSIWNWAGKHPSVVCCAMISQQ